MSFWGQLVLEKGICRIGHKFPCFLSNLHLYYTTCALTSQEFCFLIRCKRSLTCFYAHSNWLLLGIDRGIVLCVHLQSKLSFSKGKTLKNWNKNQTLTTYPWKTFHMSIWETANSQGDGAVLSLSHSLQSVQISPLCNTRCFCIAPSCQDQRVKPLVLFLALLLKSHAQPLPFCPFVALTGVVTLPLLHGR